MSALRTPIVVGIAVFSLAVIVRADVAALAERLPHNGNAVLTIDVSKLLDTPLAKTESWQSKLMSGYADRPLAVPGTARQVAMTAFLHPSGLETIIQAAIIDLPNAPRLEPMLQKQGGYLDDLGGKKGAWTSRDVYYLQLDPNTLAVLRPGDRQAAVRWVGGKSTMPMSPYLKSALSSGGDAQVLFAIDLGDAAGPGAVNYAYRMGKLPSLEKIENGREALLSALGSVKGMRLKMNVGKEINSEMTADFDKPVAALGDSAKAFVIDVLNACDLYDPQIEKWNFKASGNTIVGTGVAQPEAIGRLIAVMSPGELGGAQSGQQQPQAGGAAPDPNARTAGDTSDPMAAKSPAAASQAYYRAVSKSLDQMSAKTSPTESAAWLHAQARMMQQLPAVGVDPMLLEWGDSIAGAFNRAAQTLAIGQQNAQNAAAGVASPTATAYDEYGSTGGSSTDTPESRAAFRNAQQQRRQAAQQQRSAAADQALSILNDAVATRGKVRTLMVQKYNVEF